MDGDQVKHMVERFLQWKLPNPWHPDAGISFTPYGHQLENPEVHWPVGTNLFDAGQAEAMVRHMLEGLPEEKGGDAPSRLMTPAYEDAPGLVIAQPGASMPERIWAYKPSVENLGTWRDERFEFKTTGMHRPPDVTEYVRADLVPAFASVEGWPDEAAVERAAKAAWMSYQGYDQPLEDWALQDGEDYRQRDIDAWPERTGLYPDADMFRQCARAALIAAGPPPAAPHPPEVEP